MKLIIYDCEVFAYDWLVVFKDHETGHYTEIWNDNELLKACLSEEHIYVGFNSKHYDQYIAKAICADFTPQELKALNDFIIGGEQGWQYPALQGFYFRFNNCDLKDDMQAGLSLKAIEGHMGMDIKETDVDFALDRPLTAEERAQTARYCRHDVDATEKLLGLRKDYLKTKINLARLAGLPEVKGLAMTNAKLTAAMLKAEPKPHNDERQYVYPDNLLCRYIPQEVFDSFNRMYDPAVTDEEFFKSKLNFKIGNCPITIALGGIHAAIPNFFWEQGNGRICRNYDVGSYYPHLCTINGYTSRNIPSPQIYEDVLDRRMAAKAAGDKATADALKLVCNTSYGATLNQYNDLYDPLMARSVCISGQLYLLELANHCVSECPNTEIAQLNTDGAMFIFDEADYPKIQAIVDEWQRRTGFTLEEDKIVRLYQKDVNNYTEIQEGGKAKHKGGYLVKGVSTAGAWKINNSCCIVATALKEYFVNGTPVEETINNCNDIFQFQIIAKAGVKYREAYTIVDGVRQSVQRVNRVYATADERYGKLYKVKAENDSEAKIDSLPEHCIIDNDNHLSISDVDKTFYIEMARKRINDFKGIKPEKQRRKPKMATTAKTQAPMNVYQKLLLARSKFLEADVQKTGKNMHLKFKYFELDDIVPSAVRIFGEVGLIPLVHFSADTAFMDIVNTENPDEVISFCAPFDKLDPIISARTGEAATNKMQCLGSSITYMRRYLYMIALDICEPDDIDGSLGSDAPAPAAPVHTAPPTQAQREEVKAELTAPQDNATKLQIRGLKNVLKKLKDADPSKEELIAKIAVDTQGFTVISKADCETLIERITAMLGEGGE